MLAPRLSEDPDRQVMLLEAGPDYPTRKELPPDIADGITLAESHDRDYVSEPDHRGRTVGCCGPGWWVAMPTFAAVETDLDLSGRWWHGSDVRCPSAATPSTS